MDRQKHFWHSKTLLFNVVMILRSYAEAPNACSIQTSASIKAIKKNTREILKVLGDSDFNELFPVRLDSTAIEEFTTTDGGSCVNAAAGSALTGLGCGVKGQAGFSGALIADDMLDAGSGNSKAAIDDVNTSYVEKLSNRTNDPSTRQIIIMQRLDKLTF